MNERENTIRTYDEQAPALAEYFRGIGSRTEDIERAFKMVDTDYPHVLEIGAGDGRDAKVILERTPYYLGMDISTGMLEMAQELNPDGYFIWGDIVTFEIPKETDIIFCFASLLHSPKEDIQAFLEGCYSKLNPDGLVYISLKHSENYCSQVKEDDFGRRLFYYYNPEIIEQLAGADFTTEFLDYNTIGSTEWFTQALRKR